MCALYQQAVYKQLRCTRWQMAQVALLALLPMLSFTRRMRAPSTETAQAAEPWALLQLLLHGNHLRVLHCNLQTRATWTQTCHVSAWREVTAICLSAPLAASRSHIAPVPPAINLELNT
jgi:hypothetical protein